MTDHPSDPDQLMARALGVCWHSPTSDRWPCGRPVRLSEVHEHYRVPQRSGDYCDADGEDWPCQYVQQADSE